MKIYVKSNKDDKIRSEFNIGKSKYRFYGVIDEELGFAYGDISKLTPYDDADYYWARIDKNGIVKYIQGTKVKSKDQLFYYEDSDEYDDYESASEYIDYIITSVAEQLDELNSKIKPVMIHN